jgi:thiamine pyrophosphokinase
VQDGTVIVVAAGAPAAEGLPIALPAAVAVIAADGGVDGARALGLRVDVAVGDFDSVTADGLAAAEAGGARIERHATAKDATDLELALDVAAELAPRRLLVVGAGGGRLDHLLAGLLVLGLDRYAALEIDAILGGARVHVIRGRRALTGTPGELISLLALHGPAKGVATTGLAYPLHEETLEPGSSRGVSNVFEQSEAGVTVEQGVVLAVRPAPEAEN